MTETDQTRYLISIVGPTAAGKTQTSIELAKLFQTEIISTDSRQLYNELTIGSAKPSVTELESVKHHMINFCSVSEPLSAGQYETEATSCLSHIHKDRQVAIAVGGSGLYVQALSEGLDDIPKIPADIRDRLNSELKADGLEVLQKRLQQADPAYYQTIDQKNPRRVIRALEVLEATGKSISEFQSAKKEKPFQTLYIGLELDREVLYERINTRVDQMIDDGLVDEVKPLLSYKQNSSLETVGYAEIIRYLEGEIALEEAIDQIKRNTRRYAKRQMTWFKNKLSATWFSPDSIPEIYSHLKSKVGNI